jgi:hypothetical protein
VECLLALRHRESLSPVIPVNRESLGITGNHGRGGTVMCCDYDDPPLPNSPHAPIWEARWSMTIEERWAEDDPAPYLD